MKNFKWILGAFLVGEISTLMYKDKSFKEKLNKARGLDKIKVLTNSLVDLNKKLFYDVKDYEYEKKFHEIKGMIENEKNKLEKELKALQAKAKKMKKENLDPLVENFEDKALELRDKITDTIQDLNTKYDLEEKIDLIISKAKKLRDNKA